MTTIDNQKRIISLISEVNRKGIDNLMQFIQDSDYLTTAICHDLGKARLNERKVGCGDHPKGFADWFATAFNSPLQMLLHIGDCKSTGTNKSGGTYRFACL